MAITVDDREQEKKETGTSLMFIGLAIWVGDALVIFFLSASVKLGTRWPWVSAITALGLMGLALLLVGYMMRGKAEE
jgi:small-conductance mechanosensitive channel